MNLEEFKAKKKKQKKREEESRPSSIQDKFNSGKSLTLSEFASLKGKEYTYTVPEMGNESNEKWFKSGAFSDGYQFGDLTKTVLGTVGDASTNIVKGAGNLVEGVTDLGVYGAAGIADFLGADNFAEDARNLAKKNSVNDALGGLESYFDKNSVLDTKADSISQGLGYVGGILLGGKLGVLAGLGTTGTTALTTGLTFGSGMGGGMSEAYQSNATDEDALQYGLIKGAVEAGSELLFGGLGKTVKAAGLSKGLTSVDDVLAKKLSNKVTNQIAKNFVEYGVKASAEGLEEVIAGVGTAWAKYKTYMSDEEFSKLLEDEQLLDQFVAGAVTSSIAQSGLVPGMKQGSVMEANKSGRDFITGYTQNEQAVIDKVVENRIKEAEEGGNKLSNKEKDKIIEEVENNLKKGYIDIDSIEEALGGDSYNSYKTLSDEMDEYTSLNKIKTMELTGEQTDRLAELKKKNDTASYESEKARLKQELSKNVSEMTVNDTYLRESYNEKARRGQKYTADVSKYDVKHQETIKRAIDSGILNNTNRTHEFVDMIAKVSADKGVSFNFTDNQKLKESGFALDGRTVNGFVEGKDITLNVNSAKALNKVVGHEITHVLEGTDLYSELQAVVKAYAETKGEYQSRYDVLKELYKDQDADIEAELTADLVGDYLFTDEKFIKNLYAEQPNIFKKIFDEIKYLVKVATAGSKEAKQLEQVKRAFEKSYRESLEMDNNKDSKTKFSIGEIVDKNNKSYGIGVYFNATFLDNLSQKEQIELVKEYVKELGGQILGAYDSNGNQVNFTIVKSNRYFKNKNGKRNRVSKDLATKKINRRIKQEAITLVDELVLTSKFNGKKAPAYSHDWVDGYGKNDWEYWKTYIQDEDNNIWEAILNIANAASGEKILYDISPIKKVGQAVKSATSPTNNKLTQNPPNVKRKKSISGIHARTADYSLMVQAENMLNDGVDSELVRQETGWFKGYDGKMRFEIDDSKSELIEDPILEKHDDGESVYYTGSLSDVLKHDDLYEAYPELLDMDIVIQDTNTGVKGISFSDSIVLSKELFERKTKEYEDYLNGDRKVEIEKIEQTQEYQEYNKFYDDEYADNMEPEKWLEEEKKAREKFYSSELGKRYHQLKWGKYEGKKSELGWSKQAKEVLMHEIQHSIQHIESFARGSSEEYWQRRLDEGYPIRTIEQSEQIKELEQKYNDIANNDNEFFNVMLELDSMKPNIPRGKIDFDTLEQIEEDPIEWKEFDKRRNELVETYGQEKVFEFMHLLHDLKDLRSKNLSASDAYWKTAGEIEARDTANRMNYSKEERRKIRPDIDSKDVVFSRYSLSNKDSDMFPIGNYNVYGKDIAFEAPTSEDIATSQEVSANEDINPPEVEDMAAVEDESTELSLTEKNKQAVKRLEQVIADTQATINELTAQYDKEIQALYDEYDSKKRKDTKAAQELLERADRLKAKKEKNLDKLNNKIKKSKEAIEKINEKWGIAVRKDANAERMKHIKSEFTKNGMDFDEVLDNAKNKSNLSSVDNTPQRFFEKSFGYKEGQLLSDLTINQVAKNETKAVRWLNSLLGKKEGKITNLSKKYGIKPKSKEDAAAQMYAEGFYLNDKGDYIKYGNAELAADFPDIDTQNRIKGLAKDPLVRKIYDDTLVAINESRERNGYTAVPRRENYYMHFIEEGGFLSRIGFPFNKDTMAEKNLPTDINGMTADLKPGQPYLANAQQRKGLRTTHSLLYGMEKYVTSAKDQIYHIDDIQTFRTLRNYIADRYGQAKGLENLDSMTEEEAEARIKEVFSGHLSVMAKFLNEQANHMAGKTALIDRAAEGLFGRRALSTLKQINNQVASNMVGLNIGSSLTNFISGVQAFAKGNKYDAVKAFCQTFSNKLNSINGKSDGFAEQNDAIVRRKGADSLYQTPWQKAQNIGFTLMSAVDDVTTEFIVRTKYNELTRKGMDSKQAHDEAGKWAMRILSDRSFGQMPQLYNSRMLGLWTKFQLEVRNQLDSMGYDTIKEAEANTEHIQEQSERNKVKAAKITSTMVQLAVFQHLFGKAFESVAGYNPTFDIVETLIKLFGMDDEDDSEDTAMDNLEQAFFELAGDLPYTSLIADGGRIPISSALPLEELYNGTDKYGNEKSRLKIIGEALPYYLMPTGYGQIKKSKQGLDMFAADLPIAGSYTDSGSLRFAVEDTLANRVQAGIFGQWANENAQDYIDNSRQTLKSNQIQELADLDLPMKDYWEYRDGLKDQKTLEDKFDYIAGLDLPVSKKNIMINNIVQREEEVDMSNYDDFSGYEEFDFYFNNQDKYEFLQKNNVSYEEYMKDEDSKSAYNWAYKNPDKYMISQVISEDVVKYRSYMNDIKGLTDDKDKNDKTISGSRKDKVTNYINDLNIDYGAKMMLFKMEYPSDDTYNADIVNYLNEREDVTYQDMVTILKELGFTVSSDGTVSW